MIERCWGKLLPLKLKYAEKQMLTLAKQEAFVYVLTLVMLAGGYRDKLYEITTNSHEM